MASNQNINVDVNKGMAGYAALSGAAGLGFAAFAFGFMHPLLAGFVGLVVGGGMGYHSKGAGLLVLLSGAAMIFIAYKQVAP